MQYDVLLIMYHIWVMKFTLYFPFLYFNVLLKFSKMRIYQFSKVVIPLKCFFWGLNKVVNTEHTQYFFIFDGKWFRRQYFQAAICNENSQIGSDWQKILLMLNLTEQTTIVLAWRKIWTVLPFFYMTTRSPLSKIVQHYPQVCSPPTHACLWSLRR